MNQHPISSPSVAGYAAFQGWPARVVAAKAKNLLAGVTGAFVAEGV